MTFKPPRFFGLMGALLIAVAGLSAAFNASAQSTTPEADPPGRVARLSDLNGQVWLYSPDTAEWGAADRNRPLTSGDRLATDPGARAELQVGSTILRLDASSELEVVELDDDTISLQLHGGSMTARVRNFNDAGEVDILTEEGRFVLQRAGRYRIDRDRPASHLTVYTGEAVYEGPNSALTVTQGQRAEFWLDSGNAAQYSLSSPVNDDFAGWNGERDRAADRVVAPRYVSAEMTGVEELDRYGSWDQNSEYGALWYPRGVAVGWAPYSTGHWAYVRPWGWTWVDDAPWGFAPFHYGRWVYHRDRWGWAPGARVVRPVYAPALVAWVGGPNVSVSINIGGGPAVGWFPLAPREVYVPSYRHSPRYVQNINITHVTNITTINAVVNNPRAPRDFGNRRFPNALTVVPGSVLTARQPVAPAAAQMRNTPWVRDLTREPRRGEALVVAPIAAPVAPGRAQQNDRRPIAPPPGVAGNPRPPREGVPPRGADSGRAPGQAQDGGRGGDRNDRRPGQRDDGNRPDAAPNRPGAAVAPVAPTAGTPATPPANATPAARPGADAPGRRPGPSGAGDDRRGPVREQIPAPAAAPTPAPAVVAPGRPVTSPQPVAPVNRPAPQRDAGDRAGAQAPGADAPGRRPAVQPAQPQPQAQQQPSPAVERRTPPRGEAPAPRPPQRAEPAAAPPRPAEAQAPAAPAAPDARRPEPPQRARAEGARDDRREDRRNDARDRGDKKD
ncbi:MAG: DUF6600 domain-containing protein [Burkholderiaceae bacterium]